MTRTASPPRVRCSCHRSCQTPVRLCGHLGRIRHGLLTKYVDVCRTSLTLTLLLHVIDSSSPEMLEQIEAVEKVLKEIGADVPILQVYNKIDCSGEEAKIIYRRPGEPERVYVSAHTGEGIDLLRKAVHESLMGQLQS